MIGIGLPSWKMLAQLGLGAAAIVLAYYASKLYESAVTGPSYFVILLILPISHSHQHCSP
jgi:hypothetical protein